MRGSCGTTLLRYRRLQDKVLPEIGQGVGSCAGTAGLPILVSLVSWLPQLLAGGQAVSSIVEGAKLRAGWLLTSARRLLCLRLCIDKQLEPEPEPRQLEQHEPLGWQAALGSAVAAIGRAIAAAAAAVARKRHVAVDKLPALKLGEHGCHHRAVHHQLVAQLAAVLSQQLLPVVALGQVLRHAAADQAHGAAVPLLPQRLCTDDKGCAAVSEVVGPQYDGAALPAGRGAGSRVSTTQRAE